MGRTYRLADDFLPPAAARPAPAKPGRESRRSVIIELVIVFAITLGMSGLRSLLTLIETELRVRQAGQTLADTSVAVAAPRSSFETIDLLRQLLGIVQGLAWGGLGLYLLWRAGASLRRHLGLDSTRIGRDVAATVGLAALIGIPGLGLYLLAHQLGFAVTVTASTLTDTWWRAPVSILIAVENGFAEEVLVVAYLLIRLRQLRISPAVALGISAVLRGSYHLYQGYGGFVGNMAMGLIFGAVFLRWRRLWPLIAAHGLIDTVALVGYPLLHGSVDWLP